MGSSFLHFPDLLSWSTARKPALDMQTLFFFSGACLGQRLSIQSIFILFQLGHWLWLRSQLKEDVKPLSAEIAE